MRLFTRTGVDWTDRYPWIAEDAARLPSTQAIIDAECCCDGKDGLTDFNTLHSRLNDHAAFAYAFDLLCIDGADIRLKPLSERRGLLAKLLRKAKPGIRLSEHIEADGGTCSPTPASLDAKASCLNGWMRLIGRAALGRGSRSETRKRPPIRESRTARSNAC